MRVLNLSFLLFICKLHFCNLHLKITTKTAERLNSRHYLKTRSKLYHWPIISFPNNPLSHLLMIIFLISYRSTSAGPPQLFRCWRLSLKWLNFNEEKGSLNKVPFNNTTEGSVVDEADPWPRHKSALIVSCVIITHINIPVLSRGLILHSCHCFRDWIHLTIHFWWKRGAAAVGTVTPSDLSLHSPHVLKTKVSLWTCAQRNKGQRVQVSDQ